MSEPAETDWVVCDLCCGCGQVDDKYTMAWDRFVNADASIQFDAEMALVRPIPCPRCGGTGKLPAPEHDA